jgi:hypothetical protein
MPIDISRWLWSLKRVKPRIVADWPGDNSDNSMATTAN